MNLSKTRSDLWKENLKGITFRKVSHLKKFSGGGQNIHAAY